MYALALTLLVPLIATHFVWTEGDWSGGRYAETHGVNPEICPGRLVLVNHPSDMRYVAQPTNYQGIWAMAAYHDTLYLGACHYPITNNSADVLGYEYTSDQFWLDYQPYEQGVIAIKVYGDSLWIPGPDAYAGPVGNVYLYDRTQWIKRQTVPDCAHVFDMAIQDGVIYGTGGDWHLEGTIWRSLDWGESFELIYAMTEPPGVARRFYGAETYHGRLFFQPDARAPEGGFILTYDGSFWDTLAVPTMPLDKQGLFTAWGDSLFLTIGAHMYIYNGQTVLDTSMPFSGNRWCRSVHVYQDTLYGGAQQGRLYRWVPGGTWVLTDRVGLDPDNEEIEALTTYMGRLYLSTAGPDSLTPRGRVYVSAAAPWGRLVSEPHDFGSAAHSGVLAWDAFSPGTGNIVRLQVRSGETLSELFGAQFIGPGGSPAGYYTVSGSSLAEEHDGDRYFQYAVELLCPAGLRMPIVNSVTLEVDSLDASAVPADNAATGPALRFRTPWPSPAHRAVTIEIVLSGGAQSAQVSSALLHIRILDVQGRTVRTAFRPLANTGIARWTWNLCDQQGARVPGGVYRIIATSPGNSLGQAVRSLVVLP